MLVVHDLDETLDSRLLRRLLGRVLSDDFAGVLLEPGDEAVSVRTLAVAVVKGADDDGLLAGVTALKEDHSFVLLQKLNHGFSLSLPLPARIVFWFGYIVCEGKP